MGIQNAYLCQAVGSRVLRSLRMQRCSRFNGPQLLFLLPPGPQGDRCCSNGFLKIIGKRGEGKERAAQVFLSTDRLGFGVLRSLPAFPIQDFRGV